MAWTWESVEQAEDGSYIITAVQGDDRIPIKVNADRANGPELLEHLADVLQQKVSKINAEIADEAGKLAWIQANIDISGVE